MSTPIATLAKIDMPDGIKAKRILSGTDVDDRVANKESIFWVLGDNDRIYSCDIRRPKFSVAGEIPSLGGQVSCGGGKVVYVSDTGLLNIFSISKHRVRRGTSVESVNHGLSKFKMKSENIKGIHTNLDVTMAVSESRMFFGGWRYFESSYAHREANFDGLCEVERLDWEDNASRVFDISPLIDEPVKLSIILRVSTDVTIISFDGGYTFFPFSTKKKAFYGNKVVFDSPVVSWGASPYSHFSVALIDACGDMRYVAEHDVLPSSDDVESGVKNLSDLPTGDTGVKDSYVGDFFYANLLLNGKMRFVGSPDRDQKGHVILPSEAGNLKCVYEYRDLSRLRKGGPKTLEAAVGVTLEGGSSIGIVRLRFFN